MLLYLLHFLLCPVDIYLAFPNQRREEKACQEDSGSRASEPGCCSAMPSRGPAPCSYKALVRWGEAATSGTQPPEHQEGTGTQALWQTKCESRCRRWKGATLQQVGPPTWPGSRSCSLAPIRPPWSTSAEPRLSAHNCCFHFRQPELLCGCRLAGTHPHLSELPPWGTLLRFPPLTLRFCKTPMVSWLHTDSVQRTVPVSASGVFGVGQCYQPTSWGALFNKYPGTGGALTSRVSPVFKCMLFVSTLWDIDTGSPATKHMFI